MKLTKYKLTIHLLSDMCCGVGEGNGSSVDTLTAFDDAGLPIIPGKRLKGLLRECAELICSYGQTDGKTVSRLFGDINGERGALRVDNAVIAKFRENGREIVLSDYKALKAELPYFAPKSVVSDVFTGTRAQTKIGPNGTAEKLSLRVTQVINRCTYFTSDVYVEDGDALTSALLEDSVKLLRHIGLNKTRGFGAVECKLDDNINEITHNLTEFTDGEFVTARYTVTLDNDLVLSGGSNVGGDYISASMTQGAFARYVKDYPGFSDVFLRQTVFSNAYVNGALPMPLSMVAVKNEGKKSYSLADGYEKNDNMQYVPVGGYYSIDGDKLTKHTVRRAVEYHYSAKGKQLFTYRKLLAGQVFSGTVTAPVGVIDALRSTLSKTDGFLRFGGSSSAQYSRCRVEIGEAVEPEKTVTEPEMVVELLSDVVVRDEYGAVRGNAEYLKDAFSCLLKSEGCAEVYSKTVTGGGWNAKWKLPIQQYTAFVKGTTFVFSGCASGTTLNSMGLMRDICFGGYGQYRVRPKSDISEYSVTDNGTEPPSEIVRPSPDTVQILRGVARRQIEEYCRAEGAKSANEYSINNLSQSAAMRTLSALKLRPTRDGFENYVTVTFQQNNAELCAFAKSAIRYFDDIINTSASFHIGAGLNTNDITEILTESRDTLFKAFMREFLNKIKRRYRQQKGEHTNA